MTPGEEKRLRRELTVTRRRLRRAVDNLDAVLQLWSLDYRRFTNAHWLDRRLRNPQSPIYDSGRKLVATARREWRLTRED